jgi:GxxExxY protein
VIGAAIDVHRRLGPGLLESAYQACLVFELLRRGLAVTRQVPVPVVYDGVHLDCGYRLDIVLDRRLIVEVKAVERLDPIHTAQMLTYLRLTGITAGLLINFNVPVLVEGVRRVVLGASDAWRGDPAVSPQRSQRARRSSRAG